MKKILCLLFSLLIFTGANALAENPEIYALPSETTACFDTPYNDAQQTFSFSANVDEYGDGNFTIAVDDIVYHIEGCIGLEDTVYITSLNALYRGTLFMVNEYGPSDDPITYFFLYENSDFVYIGNINSSVASLQIDGRGTLTADVRAKYIGTWYHPADYIIADGITYLEDGSYIPYTQLCEVPRDLYPMGMIVDLNVDLPLLASRYSEESSATLKAGDKVILAASDDCHWLYVTSFDGSIAGWVYMYHDADSCLSTFHINGKTLSETDVFSNILYAD